MIFVDFCVSIYISLCVCVFFV